MAEALQRYVIKDGVFYTSEVCEINVVDHCNFSCRSCRHLSPVCEPWCVSPQQVYDDFSTLAKAYRSRTLKVLGGEPLLHPNIDDVLHALRESKISDSIIVSTNGVRFEKMSERFWELVDGIVLSTYPNCEFGDKFFKRFIDVCESHNTAIIVFHYDSFREAYTTQKCPDGDLVLRVYKTCKTAHVYRGHTIHKGYFYKCPHSVYLHEEIENLPPMAARDALLVSDRPGFARELLDFLEASEALDACAYCLGSVGLMHDHCQVKADSWRDYQNNPFQDLVDYDYLTQLECNPSLEDVCQRYVVDRGWRAFEDRATELYRRRLES